MVSCSLLNVAGDTLLDDLDLLSTLQSSKATSSSIEESLLVSEQTEKEIDLAREEYRPCAHRAAILFFVLNDMSLIDPMYQFALDAYITLFMLSIEKSARSLKLSERIESLNEFHTYALYKYALARLTPSVCVLFIARYVVQRYSFVSGTPVGACSRSTSCCSRSTCA